MRVDVPTSLLAMALVIAFSGALLVFLRRGHAWNALSVWGLAMLTAGAGLGLLGAEDVLPSWLSDDVGHTLLLLAPALSWTAARLFEERPPILPLLLAGPVLWLLGCHWHADLPDGVLENLPFPIGAAYTFATALELWRGRDEALPSRRFALGLLAFHTLLYTVRAVASPFLVARPDPVSGAVVVFVIYEGLLHTLGMAFVLFAMATERAERRATQALRELALSDPLTGLANRRKFDETLMVEIRRATRNRSALALLMIDVDHFKDFNDRYGHPAGDDALRTLANAVAAALRRPGDLVARYGGEELTVLLPLTNEAGAVAVAEHLCEAVRSLAIEHRGTASGLVTISVGVAAAQASRTSELSAQMLLTAADRALYSAKAAGRDTVRSAAASVLAGSPFPGSGCDRPPPPPPS